jgi:hypothetical protein
MWGALSDERTGLPFTPAAGPRQRSYSRVRVPWDSRPYFTVSDSILSISSPPKTCRATVEVFDPASTRDELLLQLSSLKPLCTDRVEINVSNNTSIVECVSVAAGTCLPRRCIETDLVYLLISWSLYSNGSTRYSLFICTYIYIYIYSLHMPSKIVHCSCKLRIRHDINSVEVPKMKEQLHRD